MKAANAVNAVRGGPHRGYPRRAAAFLFIVLAAASILTGRCRADDVSVSMAVEKGVQHVHGSFEAPVSSMTAWRVLTDYSHLPDFVSSMKESRVLSRGPDAATVEQTAQARFLFITRSVRVTLNITETPFAGLSFLDVSGKDFSSYKGSWHIEPAGRGCRVTYELNAKLRTKLPDALLKGLFRRQASDLLGAVRLEMKKRAAKR